MAVIGHEVHLNVCPDCGATDSGHLLDPPLHCPHQYECFVPVEFVPKQQLQGAVRLLDEFDRYASVDDGTPYAGSPFAETVRAFLDGHGGQ